MKRILSLVLLLAVVVSSVNVAVFANDSEHWAYSEIKSLIDDGIISGDQNGNLNLDNQITRAEFIKTVNKYFGFTKMAEVNFSDVSYDKWYYNEILIAKGEGYVKGDDNGNGNPDSHITRAEVSVIIARIINLTENSDCDFSDKAEIPDWAIGAVGALTEKGILNGYSDGTFRAENSILRGEAFVVIKRNDKSLPDSEEVKEEATDNSQSSGGSSGGGGGSYIPSGSSSGGSSGGGGGITQSYKASVSYRTSDATLNTIEFVAENASGYNIKFVYNDTDEQYKGKQFGTLLTLASENGTYKTADYSSLIEDAVKTVGVNGFNADIYVQAIGVSGYDSSDFVKVGTDFLKLDIPDVEITNVTYNEATGDYEIVWNTNDGITDYKVSLYSDETIQTLSKEYEVQAVNCTVPSADLGNTGSVFYLTVVAKKDNFYGALQTYQKVIVNGLDSGLGTKENPYVIKTLKQFENAFKNGSTAPNTAETYYLLTGFDKTAMSLPSDFKPLGVAFNGTLIGGNLENGEITDKIQKINFNITTGKATAGVDFILSTNSNKVQGIIFHKLEGSTVKNLELSGTVSTPNTPSFFGTLAGHASGATVTNIHNYASIDGDQQKGTGGIIGWTGSTCKITNCSNHGNITVPHATTQRADVGGIVGNMTSTTITNSYNYGNIQGRDNAGGIAGYSNCNITLCGNYGNVTVTRDTTNGCAGGISGKTNGGNITKCFNAGSVTSVKYAGGILGYIPQDKQTDVSDCFNLGTVNGTVGSGLVIGQNLGTSNISGFYDLGNTDVLSVFGASSGTITVSGAYSYGKTVTDQTNDIDKVTLSFITNLLTNDVTNFSSAVWGANDGYSYPALKENKISNGHSYVNIQLEILSVSYDKTQSKWYMEISPTGKGIADNYKLLINDVETVIEKVTDTKYEVKDITLGTYNLKLEAYNGQTLLDTATKDNFEFALGKVKISTIVFGNGKWYMTVEPSEKGEADNYKVVINDGEETIEKTASQDNLYEFSPTAQGLVSVKVEAYNGTTLIDTSDEQDFDFTFSGGLGTEQKPYIITTADQFKKAFGEGSTFVSTHFVLGADITLDSTYKPMAAEFAATLDGKKDENTNYTITLDTVLTTSDKIGAYQGGVFHKLNGATVKNIKLQGTVKSETDISDLSYLGGFTGYLGNSSTIENIVSEVYVTSKQDYATGGLVGAAGGGTNYITDCKNYNTVSGVQNTGGIIGDKFRTVMTGCYNYGAVSGTTHIGGIVGQNKENASDSIELCGNYGSVEATTGVAGGIAGVTRKPVSTSFNAGAVTAETYAGGILGEAGVNNKTWDSSITDCFNTGAVDGMIGEGLAIGNFVQTNTVKITNFYDLVNSDVSSVAGAKSGTVTEANVYKSSEKDTIKDQALKLGDNWTINAGYNYPDLKANSIVTNKQSTFNLPE